MLTWLTTPVFRYAMIALAVIAALSWLRHDAAVDATRRAEAKCLADNQAALQAERDRQAKARQEAVAEAERRAREAEQEAAQLQEKADALVKELAGSSASCALSDDVVRRLRDIR